MTMNDAIRLRPGTVVVLEGLDKAGKSTQVTALENLLDPAGTVFAHMPSGFTAFSADVYEILEDPDRRPRSGVAQQLAHLACHAENMPFLAEQLETRALLLDRWWWSTLAYGWYGGSVRDGGFTQKGFEELIHRVWAPITASVIFVFDTPHEEDSNNLAEVADGYTVLLAANAGIAVQVPELDESDTTQFILDELRGRGLTDPPLQGENG
jgi:dTMP kinase